MMIIIHLMMDGNVVFIDLYYLSECENLRYIFIDLINGILRSSLQYSASICR